MMRWTLISIATMALACNSEDSDSDTDLVDLGCGDNSPAISSIVVISGSAVFAGSDDPVKALKFVSEASDVDGDLHISVSHIWWDDVIDGSVEATDSPIKVPGEVPDGVACEVTDLISTITGQVGLGSGMPPFGTLVEVGMVVLDVEGHESGDGVPTVVEFQMPTEDDATAWVPFE